MKLDSTCPDSESLVVHQLRGLVAEVLGTSGFLRGSSVWPERYA